MDDLHPTLAAVFREPEFERRYDVTSWKLLGEGAFSWVGRVRMRDLESDVAVKVFKHLTHDLKRRIRQEVHNCQKIYSPGVVRVHTACFLGSHAAWLELELVEGHSLEDEFNARAAANTPFTFEEARSYGLAATRALAEAHAVGVIHRDIKPSNFLLPDSKDPLVKLSDFGISKHDENSPITATGEFPGTPAYGAPETFDGKKVGAGADVYSLGLVLFRLFSGGHPAYDLPEKPSPGQLMNAHKTGTPRRLRDLVQDAPRELEILLLRMLAKKPENRPALDEVLATLNRLGQASPPAGAPPPRVTASRRRVILATAATLAVAAGVLALYPPLRQRPPAGVAVDPVAAPTAPAPNPSPTTGALAGETASTPARAREPAPAIKARLDQATLAITNASRVHLADLRVVLLGAGPARYELTDSTVLAPGEELLLPLDGFQPTPPEDFRPLSADIRAASPKGTVSVQLPLR